MKSIEVMERGILQAPLLLPELKELISQKKDKELREVFSDLEPVEIAEILKELTLKEEASLFSLWDVDFATEIFEKMNEEDQIALLEAIDKERRAKILDELAPDERADLFGELPEEMISHFLAIMEKEEAQKTKELLSYPSNTAGGRMTTEFAYIHEEATITETLENLRKTAKGLETIYYVYVLDRNNRLVGIVSLKDLVLAEPNQKINQIMQTRLIIAPIDMDQEQVAKEIARYDLLALPVIDRIGRMKGIITVDDMIDVIKEEHTEDMYRFGAAGGQVDDYISTKPLSLARRRITWLLILVIMGFISGMIMERYSYALGAVVALAFFIPLLMDSAGNAGTQATVVVVRGLATGEVRIKDIWKVVRKEFITGIIVGIALGFFALARAVIMQKSPMLGISVGLSMIFVVTVATTLGSILPLLFKRLGFDPAIMSGPLITTIIDITSLVIYFEIARRLLGIPLMK